MKNKYIFRCVEEPLEFVEIHMRGSLTEAARWVDKFLTDHINEGMRDMRPPDYERAKRPLVVAEATTLFGGHNCILQGYKLILTSDPMDPMDEEQLMDFGIALAKELIEQVHQSAYLTNGTESIWLTKKPAE